MLAKYIQRQKVFSNDVFSQGGKKRRLFRNIFYGRPSRDFLLQWGSFVFKWLAIIIMGNCMFLALICEEDSIGQYPLAKMLLNIVNLRRSHYWTPVTSKSVLFIVTHATQSSSERIHGITLHYYSTELSHADRVSSPHYIQACRC